jgi:type III pantothenate kinase
MKALVLDAGNSRVKLFRWDGDQQAPSLGKTPPPLLNLIHEWETPAKGGDFEGLASSVAMAQAQAGGPALVVTSVVPELVARLEGACAKLRVVDHRSDLPFACSIDDPAAVGADRYCNVAAAAGAGLTDALVVDVGTATTFDLLVKGVFIGGLIAPGPRFALDCLGQRAARLGPVPFGPAPLAAASNTLEAMTRGGWNTGIGGINFCIEGLLREHGPRTVILTGGLGEHLAAEERVIDPHFTLRGAAVLGGLISGN